MRERFSAIIRKPVYPFEFDRFQDITPLLHKKLQTAMQTFGVVISHPTAVKAFQLKFIELRHIVDEEEHIPEIQMKHYRQQMAITEDI